MTGLRCALRLAASGCISCRRGPLHGYARNSGLPDRRRWGAPVRARVLGVGGCQPEAAATTAHTTSGCRMSLWAPLNCD